MRTLDGLLLIPILHNESQCCTVQIWCLHFFTPSHSRHLGGIVLKWPFSLVSIHSWNNRASWLKVNKYYIYMRHVCIEEKWNEKSSLQKFLHKTNLLWRWNVYGEDTSLYTATWKKLGDIIMMRNTYAETFLFSLWSQMKKEDFILKGSHQNDPFWPLRYAHCSCIMSVLLQQVTSVCCDA